MSDISNKALDSPTPPQPMISQDLLVCPFCGGYAEDTMRTGAIVCVNCNASASSQKAWNRRTTIPLTDPVLIEVREALREISEETFYPLGYGVPAQLTKEARMARAALAKLDKLLQQGKVITATTDIVN